MSASHSFTARHSVEDAADAERIGRDLCDAYFGDTPYDMSIEAEAELTVRGDVRFYMVTVDATAISD